MNDEKSFTRINYHSKFWSVGCVCVCSCASAYLLPRVLHVSMVYFQHPLADALRSLLLLFNAVAANTITISPTTSAAVATTSSTIFHRFHWVLSICFAPSPALTHRFVCRCSSNRGMRRENNAVNEVFYTVHRKMFKEENKKVNLLYLYVYILYVYVYGYVSVWMRPYGSLNGIVCLSARWLVGCCCLHKTIINV